MPTAPTATGGPPAMAAAERYQAAERKLWDHHGLRATERFVELRKPRNLLRYLRKSGDLTIPLLFAGPTLVVLAYVLAFAITEARFAGRSD